MADWVVLQITKPFSLNAAFINASKGRAKNPKYEAWRNASGWEIKTQPRRNISGPYRLKIHVGKSCYKGDIDNVIKGISDLLVSMGITDDDNKMVEVTARFVDTRDNVLIMVCED